MVATFAIIDFKSNCRRVLDSDGNLLSTNTDPEEGLEHQQLGNLSFPNEQNKTT